jgi:hypothetical protein
MKPASVLAQGRQRRKFRSISGVMIWERGNFVRIGRQIAINCLPDLFGAKTGSPNSLSRFAGQKRIDHKKANE